MSTARLEILQGHISTVPVAAKPIRGTPTAAVLVALPTVAPGLPVRTRLG